ncbi:hypothetical protein IWW36_002924 [Coemansia brasiliensis]|uniref:Transmembrane protein n=1 Tax=Coemansia brasiliensis TaxID=2650707 RepID=A0A9W8I8S1_9FUNG|nr:hypothetical protein IWW36_002924 [Coemansia brasiliensis]
MNRTDDENNAANSKERQLRSELEALSLLSGENNPSLETQYDSMNEMEQKRLIEKLTLQTQADIQAFSMFLKLPTVAILVLKLVFAYSYVTNGSILPFRILTEHPIMATEISVVILQFTLYLLSSERWNYAIKGCVLLLLTADIAHILACSCSGIIEVIWWMLPLINLAVVCYAQFNMRRSRDDIEKLASRAYHDKND